MRTRRMTWWLVVCLACSRAVLADRCLVIVYDWKAGIPADGAEVRWFASPWQHCDPDDPWTHREVRETDPGILEAKARQCGEVAYTDSTGAVFVPVAGEESVRIVARKGELWGTAITGTSTAIRLDLVPTFDLEVKVVDEQGRPVAEIPVVLRGTKDDDSRHTVAASISEPSGMAVLRHAGYLMACASTTTSWSVSLDLLLAEPVEVAIVPGRPPDGPIWLVMPPTGEVEVVLRNNDGSPGEPADGVALVPWKEGRWKGKPPARRHSQLSVVVDGRALFRHVGLNTKVMAIGQQNRASRTAWASGWGPTRPGERVRMVLGLGWGAVELRGQVVDERGVPLASTRLFVELFSDITRSHKVWINISNGLLTCASGPAWTDEEGILRLDFELDEVEGGKPLLLLARDHDEPDALSRCVDLERHWSPGFHDLGEVVLPPAPVLVAGRVLDDRGVPLADVDVSIFVGKNARGVRSRTSEDGAFVLRGAEPLPMVDVILSKEGHASDSCWSFPPGRTDLSFRFAREAVIEGRVLLPPGLLGASVSVELRGNPSEYSTRSWSERLRGERFRFDHLAAGRYEVSLREGIETLAEREVEVSPGEKVIVVLDASAASDSDHRP